MLQARRIATTPMSGSRGVSPVALSCILPLPPSLILRDRPLTSFFLAFGFQVFVRFSDRRRGLRSSRSRLSAMSAKTI